MESKGKNTRIVILLISLIILVLLMFDFMALHDIHKDYISHDTLSSFYFGTTESLPQWTHASLEWTVISISQVLKSVLIIINIFLVLRLIKTKKQ